MLIIFKEKTMPPRRKQSAVTLEIIQSWAQVLGFIGAAFAGFYFIAVGVPTKPWVEEGLKSNREYADSQVARAFEKAISHADGNYRDNQIRMEKYHAEVKSLDTKLDMLIQIETGHPVPKKQKY